MKRYFIVLYSYKSDTTMAPGLIRSTFGNGHLRIQTDRFPSIISLRDNVLKNICEHSVEHGEYVKAANIVISQILEVSEQDYLSASEGD